jgi:MFS family permease
VLLVGRRLGAPILGAALFLNGALAALAAGLGLAGTVVLLTVAGASRALLDVATRSLLQRSVPAHSLGQVFGLLEGLTMAGLAIGAVLVPVLVHFGGSRLALLGVAAVLPLARRGRRARPVQPGRPRARPGRADRIVALDPAGRRTARPRARRPRGRPHPG